MRGAAGGFNKRTHLFFGRYIFKAKRRHCGPLVEGFFDYPFHTFRRHFFRFLYDGPRQFCLLPFLFFTNKNNNILLLPHKNNALLWLPFLSKFRTNRCIYEPRKVAYRLCTIPEYPHVVPFRIHACLYETNKKRDAIKFEIVTTHKLECKLTCHISVTISRMFCITTDRLERKEKKMAGKKRLYLKARHYLNRIIEYSNSLICDTE